MLLFFKIYVYNNKKDKKNNIALNMELKEPQFFHEENNKYFVPEQEKNKKNKDEEFEEITNFYVDSLTDQLNKDDYDEFSSPAFDTFLKREGAQKTLDLIESVYFNKNLSEENKQNFLNNIVVEELSFLETFLKTKQIFEFIEELTKRFDLKTKDKEKQKRTKGLLEIFRNLKTLIYTSYEEMLEAGGYEKDEIKSPEDFFADIKKISEEKDNNYFLSLRLRKIVDEIVFYHLEEPATDKDVYPFKLSKKIFALYDENGELKITQKKDYEEVKRYFNIIDLYRRYKELEKEYLTLQSEFIEEYIEKHPEETEDYKFPEEISYQVPEDRFDNTVFTKGSIYEVEDKIKEEFKQNEDFFKKFPKAKAEMEKKIGDLEDRFFQLRGEVFDVFGEDENGRINTGVLERYEHKIEKFFHKITSLKDIDFFTEKQKQDFIDNLNDYKYLMSKPIRESVNEEFGIDITQFSALEQSYFLQFLKDKTNQEVDQVKEFLKQSKNEQSKNNRIKSFLSLEQDPQMGEIILKIGEELKDEPRLADEIFSEYAKMIDNVNDNIDFFVQIYKEVFPNKELDKNKATQAILRKASSLIKQAFEELENASETEKEKVVKKLISDLHHQEKINKKILNDLIHISKLFNQSKKKLKDELFLQGGEHAIASELFGDPEQYKTPQELDEAIQKGEITPWWMDENFDMEKILDKMDSSVLEKIIQASQKSIKKLETMLPADGYYEMIKSENIQNAGKPDKIDKKTFTKIKDEIKKANRKIDKAKKVLQFQKNLENKFQQLIFEQEPTELLKNFIESIQEEILNYQIELKKTEETFYFPVGISSRLPAEGEEHKKPIDMLVYLFWLKNQGGAELMIADTMQKTNYQALYGLSEEKAEEKAKKNGELDKNWYNAVIKVFGMQKLIQVGDFQEITEISDFNKIKNLLEEYYDKNKGKHPIARALKNLVEPGIRNKAIKNTDKDKKEKERMLADYGMSEVAFILAKDKQIKISHEKELRYDFLSRVISVLNIVEEKIDILKEILKKQGRKPKQFTSPQGLVDLSIYLAYHDGGEKSKVSEKKINHIAKNILRITKKGLDKIKREYGDIGKELLKKVEFQHLNIPKFYYPKKITGMSFEMADEKGVEYGSFKEPYSTIQGKNEEELPIEANQLIASTNPMIITKLLVLSTEKQEEYLNKILKPLLVNYYIATSKDKNEASARFEEDNKNIKTISDVVDLIQRKIIWPIELELQEKK